MPGSLTAGSGLPAGKFRIRKLLSWEYLTAFAVIIILLLFRSRQFTGDSLMYALKVQGSESMFHPHHLLFSPLIWLVHRMVNLVGIEADVLTVAQFVNAGFAGMTVLLTGRLARKLIKTDWVFPATAIFLLSCYGFWYYSMQMEVYIASMACMAGLLLMLFKGMDAIMPDEYFFPDWKWVFISAGWYVAAIMFHQTAILIGLPFAAGIILRFGFGEWKKLLAFFAISGAVSAGIYIMAIYIDVIWMFPDTPFFDVFTWFIFRYEVENPGWGLIENISADTWLLMGKTQWKAMVFQHDWAGEPGDVAGWLSLLFLWHIVKVALRGGVDVFRRVLIAWLFLYHCFIMWWLPTETEFFIVTLIPIYLLILLVIKDVLSFTERFIGRFSPALLIIPVGLMLWQNETNVSWFSKWANEISGGEDAANKMFAIGGEDAVYLTDYYTEQHLLYLHPPYKTVNAWWLKNELFRNKRLPESVAGLDEKAWVTRMNYLHPEDDPFGFTVFQDSASWTHWINFLMDVEADGDSLLDAKLLSLHPEGDEKFLVIHPQKITYEGWESFAATLDSLSGDTLMRFTRWLVQPEKSDANQEPD